MEHKEFSFESKEKQKKTAARLISMEFAILVVVIIFILGALVYLKVIPVEKITNQVMRFNDKTNDRVVPAQKGYGPNDDSSDWVEPEWMKK